MMSGKGFKSSFRNPKNSKNDLDSAIKQALKAVRSPQQSNLRLSLSPSRRSDSPNLMMNSLKSPLLSCANKKYPVTSSLSTRPDSQVKFYESEKPAENTELNDFIETEKLIDKGVFKVKVSLNHQRTESLDVNALRKSSQTPASLVKQKVKVRTRENKGSFSDRISTNQVIFNEKEDFSFNVSSPKKQTLKSDSEFVKARISNRNYKTPNRFFSSQTNKNIRETRNKISGYKSQAAFRKSNPVIKPNCVKQTTSKYRLEDLSSKIESTDLVKIQENEFEEETSQKQNKFQVEVKRRKKPKKAESPKPTYIKQLKLALAQTLQRRVKNNSQMVPRRYLDYHREVLIKNKKCSFSGLFTLKLLFKAWKNISLK